MAEYKGSVGVGGGLTQLGGGKFAIANAPDIQVDDNGKRLNEWISETTENLREKANSELVEEIKESVGKKASQEEVEQIKNNLQEQINQKAPSTAVSSPYNFKGNCLFSELPTSGNTINDTWYCTDVKTKYTWNGTAWYQSSLDESDYQDELSRVKTIAVSEEEPTNENVVAYINPKRGNPISVVTAEDIAQELVNRDDKIPSSFAVKDVTDNLNLRLTSAEEKIEQGLDEEEITKNAVSATKKWLDEHPEATTTVQDGSLTEAKFSDDLKLHAIKDYVTPKMFGAVCDGTTDDSAALQRAIDSGKPVRIDKTLAIANPVNVPDYGNVTIERDVTVNITADVDGFVIRDYTTIEGFGSIKVTVENYTHICITLYTSSYSMVKDISIYGFNHNHQDGIGIAILSCEENVSGSSCAYNRLNNVNICWLEIGVLLRGFPKPTDANEHYNWNNNHDIDIHSSFCANAIHSLCSHHNQIKVFGESAYQKVSKRTKYPCAYDTEIYLNDSTNNSIFNNLVDTGNDGHNQYIVQYDNKSQFNTLEGSAFDDKVLDYSYNNYINNRSEIKNMPIAGVNSILDDPSVIKKYEAFGTATISFKGLFQYPPLTTARTLLYANNATTDADNWDASGVSLECDFNNNREVSPRYLSMSSPPSQTPYKVGVVVSGVYNGSDYSIKKTIPYGMILNRVVDLNNFFVYEHLANCKKIKFVFYGCYNYNKNISSSIATINYIALTHNENFYSTAIDEFAGIRRTGGSMTGELNVLAPTKESHAVNKGYVDNLLSNDGTNTILFGKKIIFNTDGTVTWEGLT